MVPEVEELSAGDPIAVARENARRKAVAVDGGGRPVVGVDTVVVLQDQLYGKPRDESHAREMLEALSDQEHVVVSGLALAAEGGVEVVDASTTVLFRDVRPLLDWYLRSGEWRERAGGYAIQGRGAAFVSAIRGDYLNVVGLPVAALLDLWSGVLHQAR